jgi:hypothetical protein
VHWLIATDTQIADGIKQAVGRVRTSGVFIEGNSFTESVDPDFFVMVARAGDLRIKPTARRALSRVSAIYLSGETDAAGLGDSQYIDEFLLKSKPANADRNWAVFTHERLPKLVKLLRESDCRAAA